MKHFVIYDHPTDYPDGFVVREWEIVEGSLEPLPRQIVGQSSTLAGARTFIPLDCVMLRPDPSDDAKIKEIWI